LAVPSKVVPSVGIMKDITNVVTIVKILAKGSIWHATKCAYLVASVTLVILGLIKRVIPMAHASQKSYVMEVKVLDVSITITRNEMMGSCGSVQTAVISVPAIRGILSQ